MHLAQRVSYPKKEWSRGEAWDHLHSQMIPGCPKVPGHGGKWYHGWRKEHGATEWTWVYRPHIYW